MPRRLLCILLITAFTGCAEWHAVKGPPADYVAHEKPGAVRATIGDSVLVMKHPEIRGDSLVGLRNSRPPERLAVQTSSIQKLESNTLKGSTNGKFLAVGLTALGIYLGLRTFAPHGD
jgi:hypothetical protein